MQGVNYCDILLVIFMACHQGVMTVRSINQSYSLFINCSNKEK